MKKLIALSLAAVMCLGMLAGCGKKDDNSSSQGSNNAADSPVKGKKVAYILNGAMTDIFKMSFDAAKKEAEALGMTLDTYNSDNDDLKFQDMVNQNAQKDYDAMFISHGKPDYAYELIAPIVEKGIKVVTFDTVLTTPEGKEPLKGITQMFQNDQEMATMTLDYICNELFPNHDGPVKVLKLWRGPGVPPFDRRQESYKKFEDEGKITTLEVLGPSNPADAEGSTAQVVASVLPKYPKGTADVVWSCYDAYGRGAWKSLNEAGRTDLPIVSIDISNQDINLMRDENKVWKACVAVHFETVGISGVRLLAKKLAGEETPDEYILAPSLVKAEDLTAEATVMNLGQIVEGYGVNNDNISDWMKPLREAAGLK